MIVKEYTIIVTVVAKLSEDFPSIDGLVNGMNDGLPDDWFSDTEGDDFYIKGWHYHEANNPKYIGLEGPIDQMGDNIR